MTRRRRPACTIGFGALVLLAATGCAGRGPTLTGFDDAGLPVRVELGDTPFFAQDRYQCGPAALATLLAADSVDLTPDELVAEVYLPGRRGSLSPELIAATRKRDRVPYLVEPEFEALLRLVAAGEPVLLLQRTGAGLWPGWHYAVLIGYDLEREHAWLRSGLDRRKQMSFARLAATWEGGGRWAMAALRPGAPIPAPIEFERYIEGAAGLEAVGRRDAAEAAYTAAAQRWPQETLPRLGLANLAYARGDLQRAQRLYADIAAAAPGDVIARNNRALVLLELGCPVAARAVLASLPAGAEAGPHAAAIASTRGRIDTAPSLDGPSCTGTALAQ